MSDENLGCGQRLGMLLASIVLFTISFFFFKYGMIYGWLLGGFLALIGFGCLISALTGDDKPIEF